MEKRAFNEMHQGFVKRFEAYDPDVIAFKAGVTHDADAHCWRFESFGREVAISYPALTAEPELNSWHLLTLLQYLELADGAPLDMEPMTFTAQKDGMVRGGGFDRDFERMVRNEFGTMDPDLIRQRCETLGAHPVKTNADLSLEFWFAPRYPVTLKIWFADEDDPASGRMLLVRSANHYLPVEPSLFVGELIINAMRGLEH